MLPSSTVDDGIDQRHEQIDIGNFGSLDIPFARSRARLLDGKEPSCERDRFDLLPRQPFFLVAHSLLVQTDRTKGKGLTSLIGSNVARPQQARGFPGDGRAERFDVVESVVEGEGEAIGSPDRVAVSRAGPEKD